jgi:capsular polysaccharide biosynthesis protein
MSERAIIAQPSWGKVEAIRALASHAGFADADADAQGTGVAATLLAIGRVMGRPRNAQINLRPASDIPGVTERLFAGKGVRTLPPPNHRSGMPECFTDQSPVAHTPDFRLLNVPGGYLCHVPDAPVVVSAQGDVIAADYSSRFAGLVHFYDYDMRQLLADAHQVNGSVIVMADDVRPLNFCHWLVDWLPRLACLGERTLRDDTYVIVPPLDAQYQWDTLRLCGFPPSRVIQLGRLQAVRARQLLVPSDLNDIPHPGHKAAPWLLQYVRGTLGYGAFLAGLNGPQRRGKLYISRDDTAGRRVVNEDALRALLARFGYQTVRLAGLSMAQQIAHFATATHIVAPHGAGLANVVFANPSATLIELFPSTYGTAAFYVLAAGVGLTYASYISGDVVAGSRTQLDDMVIDIDDFVARCGALL